MLLWEIITWGDTPYKNVPTLEALLELIKDGYRMGRPGHCPWRLWEVIKSCWMHHPEARPGWPQLITSLLGLYNDTLPGEYLELSHTSLPTPPSSPENTGDQFSEAGEARRHDHTSQPPYHYHDWHEARAHEPGYYHRRHHDSLSQKGIGYRKILQYSQSFDILPMFSVDATNVETETDNFQYQERNMRSIRNREHRRSEYQQLIYREDVERLLR